MFALYVKTKNFHWHMSGPHFRDYHLLLDEQAGSPGFSDLEIPSPQALRAEWSRVLDNPDLYTHFVAERDGRVVGHALLYRRPAGNLRVPVPWISVVLAFVVACSTGLIFGYLPADKAARLQPTESLRYE